jgi:hypothetical protein
MFLSGLTLSMVFVACAASAIDYMVIDQQATAGKRFPALHFEVIGDEAIYKKLFVELNSHHLPSPLPPEIDFESSFVLFVSMGEKPTAGYRVEIEEMKRSDETLKVKLRLQEPSPGGMNAMVLTQPFVMAKVKKEKGIEKVEFLDQKNRSLGSVPISQ